MSFYLKMLSKALWRSRAVFDKANTNSKLFALDQGGKIHCLAENMKPSSFQISRGWFNFLDTDRN